MKALSIRQPWAELILQGRKTVELRTWRTNYRGRFLIHAAQKVNVEACEAYGLDPASLVRGAVVGSVELVDILDFDEASYDEHRGEHLRLGEWPGDLLGWRLAEPERLPEPIPMNGKRNLFDVELGEPDVQPVEASEIQPEPPRQAEPGKPFELRVEPQSAHSYSLALYQWPVKTNGAPAKPARVVVLGGDTLLAVADHVLEALRHSDYRVTDLSPRRQEPFWLGEETGVRLALLFLSVAPLSRMDRVDAISRELRAMPTEEAYYWYSKCMTPEIGTRAQRALRVLLAAE